jgi:hypothetical protein
MHEDIFNLTPHATGNLRREATLLVRRSNSRFEVYVDETIAPYFKYVNNAKTLTYWRYQTIQKNGKVIKDKSREKVSFTKENRNYQYFEKAFEEALKNMANKIGGTIIRG